jgi:hypothetical protein
LVVADGDCDLRYCDPFCGRNYYRLYSALAD